MSNNNRINAFSVIICVYNAEEYLKKCVDSVLCQLSKNDELIIVNDCSTDNGINTLDVYKNINQLRIINNQKNYGLAYSRNTGYSNAVNNIVFYIDADTVLPENTLDKIDLIFQFNTEIFAVTGRGIETNINTIYDEYRKLFFSQTQGFQQITNPPYISGLCMAIKKNILQQLNGFNLIYKTHAEDVDFAYKLKKNGLKYIYSPDLFVFHNRRDDEKSLKKMLFNHIYWSIKAHHNNGYDYSLKYFFASFKIILQQIFICCKLKKIELCFICFSMFVIRLKSINNSSALHKKTQKTK